ncbi:MAG TPA: alkaline phosphatase family protein [Terriglobales bacterium]
MSCTFVALLLALGLALDLGCGGAGSGGGTGTSGTGTTGGTTSGTGTGGGGTGSSAAGPVILVVEENHGFSTVIGNSAMPYLNSLAQQGALGTQYFANTHPSINNYFEMTAGKATVAPPPDPDSFDGPVNVDNIVRHLLAAGKTWKAYAESLPSVGYTGGDSGAYLHHHNPLSYFTDVVNSLTQRNNLVPFTQFATDLAAGHLPDFSFVVPNANNDAHDCPANMIICLDTDKLKAADTWLKTNIDPLLSSAQFKQNGLLIIVFDEAEVLDTTHGGGQVAVVVVGPKVKTKFQSTTLHQHQDLLKMITTYMGVDSNIGDAATAAGMTEFFQ